MINSFTVIDLIDEGGSANFYKIKESKSLGFKEFRSKTDALFAYKTQKKLAKLGLAPKVYGKIRKLFIENWEEMTGWGFLTQMAKVHKRLSREKIQNLVDNIYKKTKLNFWDCHEYNIGIINKKYVCLDTGKESFDPNCNAWGLENPGPKCGYCNKYNCKCDWDF